MAAGKDIRALVVLVLFDGGLKAWAWAGLRHRPLAPGATAPMRLGYVENGTGFGFDQARLLERYGIEAGDSFIACSLAALLALALLILLWHRIEARPWIKTAVAAAAYAAVAALSLRLCDSMSLSFPPYLRGLLRCLGPLAVALALFSCVRLPYYRALALLLLSGTIGNSASLLLPPFAVIDFLGVYRPSAGTYVYANAADAYLVAAAAMILLVPAYLAVRRARSSSRNRASSA
jgi:lipoprotein signal peptidase